MEPVAIGARNPRLRRLRRLVGRSRVRSEERAFVVDGPTLVAEALASRLDVLEVFAAPGALVEAGLVEAIEAIEPDVEVFDVEASVLESVLDPVSPRPMAAVVAMPDPATEGLPTGDGPILVAVELRDPGNLGTIIRTAEAAGLAGVVVAGESVDRFAPKVVRASAGSLFRLPVIGRSDTTSAIGELAAAGRLVVAAVVGDGAVAYDEVDLTRAAILMGNEPHGLPAELVARADAVVTIPMAPGVESLNVGAATAVLCFEAARQRRAGAGGGVAVETTNPVDSHRSVSQGGHNESRPAAAKRAEALPPTLASPDPVPTPTTSGPSRDLV